MKQVPPPLRVLHVINHDQQRGAENVAASLARGLESPEVTNRVVALGPTPSGSPPLGVQRLSEDRGLTLRGLARRTGRLRQLVKEERPNVVLAHGGQACLHAVLATRVPVVWHRILELPDLGGVQRLLWSFVARRSTGAIAITDRLEDELSDLGHRGPVLRVPNVRPGVPFRDLDHEVQRQMLARELGLDSGELILGFVGHLVEQKDPLLALEVFEVVGQQLPNASFLFAGDGPLSESLRSAVARSTIRDRVHVLGHRDDVPALLSGLDLLLITSRSESMAGISVEAALAGCPVVTCDFDGAADVVVQGASGRIVGTRQAEAIATAAIQLAEDREQLHAARIEARAVGEQFELERHLPAYRSFLEGQARHAPRVLFLMPDIGVGGAERALEVIARHHDRNAMHMDVATLRPPRRPEDETVLPALRELGITVRHLALTGRADRSPVPLVQAAFRLRRLCRARSIDIVDSCLFEADIVARFALLGARTKHVVHLVSTPYAPALDESTATRRRWRRWAIQQLDRRSARLTDSFIAITLAVAAAAVRDLQLTPDEVTMISRGVDLARFTPLPLESGRPLRLLSVGRLVPAKAHDVAIRAVALAVGRGTDLRLTIHGEGPLRHDLNALAHQLGVADRVDLAGPINDVAQAHACHDAFVFLSRWEGQGNALLEAMACARPVVASDLPVLREVLGSAGRLVPAGDAEATADEFLALAGASSIVLSAEGLSCRRRVEQLYDAVDRVRDLQSAYRGILGAA